MNKKLSLFATVLAIGFTSNAVFAQTYSRTDRKGKLLADNISISKQAQRLDSIIASQLANDEQEFVELDSDNPASEMYEGAWSSRGVNANRVFLDKMQDSVQFDLSGFVNPINSELTSVFGPRRSRYHYGVDIELDMGDPIVSAWDGKVRVTSYDRGGYGSYVVVRHNNGLETVYGHLSDIKVFEGQTVRAGQLLGLGGSSGRSSGPHLHFETRFLGNPINPERFIDYENGEIWADSYTMKKDVCFDYIQYTRNPGRYYSNYRSDDDDNNNSSSNNRRDKKHAKGKSKSHKVKNGETLSHIADKYNVPIKTLCKLNKIGRNAVLRPGQKVKYS